MLDITPNQPSKFKTKNWVEINDESRETYNKDNQVRFKIYMSSSSLCDYSDAYILVKGAIAATSTVAQGQPNNCTNRKVIFENCALFTNSISRINSTLVFDAHIVYSDNYSKKI